MASDVPAYLEVGTPVSAKFKGAFCEATIKAIKKLVKCKVVFKVGCGSIVVNSDHIQGDLILNSVVHVKQEDGDHKEGILQKMNDHSLYTVVFDDGDERTLKRTNVCVMGEKHFREHENLDNLPLTDPENFLTPVLLSGDKRRKRNRARAALDDEDSDSDGTKSAARRWIDYDKEFLGKVVCIELGERKKSWFPALGLKSYVNQPDSCVYVQSFKDGKKMLIQKEDVKEFHKDKEPLASYFKGEVKIEPILRSSIDKALAYNDFGELPKGWNILDTIDEKEDSSDEENGSTPIVDPTLSPESKTFQEIVNNFMNRQGIPITKAPVINNQTVDLCKLYEFVQEFGGMDEVSNQQWRTIYTQLGLQNINTAASSNMKSLYKRYLGPYEEFMKNSTKSPGRQSRQKAKQRQSKESVKDKEKEKEKDDLDRSSIISESDSEPDRRRSTRSSRNNCNEKLFEGLDNKKKRGTASSGVGTRQRKWMDRKFKLDSFEGMIDSGGEDSSDKNCFQKEFSEQDIDMKSEAEDVDVVNSPQSSMTSEDNDSRVIDAGGAQIGKYKPGTRIAVRYGSGKNQRLYNAKILEVEKEENGEIVYFIHYNGWNHRYDEWIKDERIHGPSSTAPTKRKNGPPPTPLSKIRKDPPKKFQAKIDSDTALLLLPPTKRTPHDSFTSKVSKSPAHTYEKPSSPIKSPIYTPEHLPDPVKPVMHSKQSHRPKPVNETLFIPDIKPSPVKPRLTRNSMQDTFLLNALEESIGKQNPAAMNLQQDILLKSESNQTHRRRSNRQTETFTKSDNTTESDISSKDDKDSNEFNSKKDEKPRTNTCVPEFDSNSCQFDNESVDKKTFSSLDPKESSKEETVKKWIEDSNKILSTSSGKNEEDLIKKENEAPVVPEPPPEDEKPAKRGRRTKNTSAKTEEKPPQPKKKKTEESEESDSDAIKTEPVTEESRDLPQADVDNNNLPCEKEAPTESSQSQMLSDFCTIVENAKKLEANAPVEEEASCNSNSNTVEQIAKQERTSPSKENDKSRKHKRHHDKHKRKISQSMNDDEYFAKQPKERKEKRTSPPLEYNVDFMSDLSEALAEKDPVERIVIMQSRLNAMRKLYCKLRSEVASIDRRRRRKLRKQSEIKQKSGT